MKSLNKNLIILSLIALCSFFGFARQSQAQFEKNNDIYVDLAWTCSSYTPEGYNGKALPTRGSSITVSATPHFKINGKLLAADTLNYRWFLDEEIIGSNKPEFTFTATKFRSYTHEVRVLVSTSDESVSSQEWIEIKVYTPEIQVYEYDGAAQINLSKGIGEELSAYSGSALAFAAIPYYFNIRNIENISYNWKIQGSQITKKFTELPHILEINIQSGVDAFTEKILSITSSNKYNSLESSIKNIILKINENIR